MDTSPMSFRKIVIDLFFKAPLVGFTTILSPCFVAIAILQHFGFEAFRLNFTLNHEPIAGWLIYLLAIVMGPLTSMVLSVFLWPFLMLGFWIYSKFRPF